MSKTRIDFGQGRAYDVEFPNAGQMMDIWNNQMMLSNNNYQTMLGVRTRLGDFMVELVDAIATFSVLIPDLGKELAVKSFTQLPMKRAKELVKVYREQYYPWYSAIMKELLDDEEEVVVPPSAEQGADTAAG